MRFLQLPGTVVTAHFNCLAADFDFDGISVQLAVASRTSRFNHGIALPYPKSGSESSRPRSKRTPLSESLAICEKGLTTKRRLAELRRRTAVSFTKRGAEMAVTGEAEVQAQSGEVIILWEKIQCACQA